MFGICVAVNATTSYSGRSRYTKLKLGKSRPAAPAIRTRVLAMYKAYSSARTAGLRLGSKPCWELAQNLANALGDGLHLERGARHLLQHLLGTHLLTFAPELAQQRAGLTRREPARAELLLQVRAQLRLEGPRSEV